MSNIFYPKRSVFVPASKPHADNTQYLESGEFLNKERTIRVAMSPTLFLFQHFAGFIKDIISVISYSYIIVQINPWLLSIFLLKIIITGVLNAKQQQEQYNFENEVVLSNRRLEYIHNTIFDISSAKEIRINGAFSWLITKYKKENRNNIKIIQKKSKKDIKHSIIKNIIEQIQTLITYGYSSYLAVNNVISVGNFTAFIASISRFINSFDSVINQSVGLYYISKRVDFFMEYLSYFKKSDENKCSIPEHILDNPCIEFKNVSFKYPNSSDYVLKNISLKIIPKEKLAIVGHNGSGKTTFVKLLCKLYEPTEGEILLNGKNINYYNTKEYRKLFGVLMQDFKLFDFRVKDNIVLNKEFNEELFDNSIEKADAKSLIHSLPFGINTYCGRMFDENGVDLSGGENQRIGLSRTYYGKAKILILDEPDSALDVYSENKIYDSFKSAMKDTTSLYISHRLALCTYCDRILVFDDGCLAENGSHYELMHNDGIYAEMFKKQTSYYKN